MSHNSGHNSCESLAPSGCHRLHENRKKMVVIELGRTRTRFVLARTFHTLLKACEALCVSAPATDTVLCAQCSVSLVLQIIDRLRVFVCLARQVAGFSSYSSNQPSPSLFLHTDHAHAHRSDQSDNASQKPDKKNKFPCFSGVCEIATHRDAHIKCHFRTNANTEDKTSAGCPGVLGVPSGQLKGSHRLFTFVVSQLLWK